MLRYICNCRDTPSSCDTVQVNEINSNRDGHKHKKTQTSDRPLINMTYHHIGINRIMGMEEATNSILQPRMK